MGSDNCGVGWESWRRVTLFANMRHCKERMLGVAGAWVLHLNDG